jgi:hypothetical protein
MPEETKRGLASRIAYEVSKTTPLLQRCPASKLARTNNAQSCERSGLQNGVG